MRWFKHAALTAISAAGLLFVAALPLPNSVTIVANLTALQNTPIASAYSGVVERVTDGTAGAPPMPFLPGEGTCASTGYTNDGASCVDSSDGNHWLGYFPNNVMDVRQWSPACNAPTTDSTAAVQATVIYLATGTHSAGGTIVVPCGLHIAGTVTLGSQNHGSLRLTGSSAMYGPGMLYDTNTNSVWPPTSGPYIDCGNTSGNCIQVAGQGVEIDHLPFGNTQPAPPSSGSWTPTQYGYIIGTTASANWGGLYIHDDSFTAATNCIDLEGSQSYVTTGIAGSQYRLAHLWMNPCLQEGIRGAYLDNTGNFEDIHYDFWWNRATAPVGAYVKNHSIGIDACYLSNTMMNGIEFYANWRPVQYTNCTVVYDSNPAHNKTFAAVNLQMLNIDFNETCTGFSMPNGNGTVITGVMSNVIAYMDTNGQCPTQTTYPQSVFFDLSSDYANFTISHLIGQGMQTIAAIGHGSNGWLRMPDAVVQSYSAMGPGAPAFMVSANTHFSPPVDPSLITPASGAGNFLGAGVDGSQGYATNVCNGGGVNPGEGSACLQGSHGGTVTGALTLFDTSNTEQAYVGAASAAGLKINAVNGGVYLNSNSNSATTMTGGGFVPPTVTVAGLPTCNTSHKYWAYEVTDAAGTPTYLSNVTTGGGSSNVLVVCNGAGNWQAH